MTSTCTIKCSLFFGFFLGFAGFLSAQNNLVAYDTLLAQDFTEIGNTFLIIDGEPTGHDESWVNWDEDGYIQWCVTGGSYGFYAPIVDMGADSNTVMASCSWTSPTINAPCNGRLNRNWLITEPILIDKPYATLEWKSMSDVGPYWVDGYQVLVSKTTNFGIDFTDTLFTAASTITPPDNSYSLNVNDYDFTPGYIHADSYTNSYFYLESYQGGPPGYLGILEPHSVDLSAYFGETIYIAFLHDAYCNSELQLDDILVVESESSAAFAPPAEIGSVKVFPQPAGANCIAELKLNQSVQLAYELLDSRGRIVQKQFLGKQASGNYTIPLDLTALPMGVFYLKIKTENGVLTEKIMHLIRD